MVVDLRLHSCNVELIVLFKNSTPALGFLFRLLVKSVTLMRTRLKWLPHLSHTDAALYSDEAK